jgi:aminopeptidase N
MKNPMPGRANSRRLKGLSMVALLTALMAALQLRADEPYARARDYDLQHSRIALRFDLEQKEVLGDVTHSLSILRDDTSKIWFDSVGLTIQSVTVNKSPTHFETTADKLIVPLPGVAKIGDKFEVAIRYEGKPTKGMYFVLPDKDYPDRPKQIWTQGESEDTRYYLPTYDYPNDRLTTETILTVPASWITVSNGKLISVSDAGNGLKTWTWRESVPSSTYLITVVAGEFDEKKDSWRGMPVTYYAPKGRGDRLLVNYSRTPAMIDLFSKRLGVDYPWEKYAQVMVDDFVAGGMENSSATTNTSSSLNHAKIAAELYTGEDGLISHELGHQWFGDLVTCKDWGDIWLNEGFATFMETVWTESHYGKDIADMDRWLAAMQWFGNADLFNKPIVRHDFEDSSEFDGNAYTKGGWVLYMLRHQLGEDAFYRGLKHYLEVNRGKNVVTADLAKAIEESSHTNVDQFFSQWLYGAGAPKFDLGYSYDNDKHQVALTVKQTQKVEGRVGIFRVPADVEITTSSGPKLYSITVSKPEEIFTFPASSAPHMVLFDKGGNVLKTAEFHKEKKEWLYQLKNAAEVADRDDAAFALGKLKNDEDIVSALGTALRNDKALGVRFSAADMLGKLGGTAASKQLLDALDEMTQFGVRARIVTALGNLKDDPTVVARLTAIAKDDHSYRARAAALQALGKLKSPGALAILEAAASGDSPDGYLRDAALRALGPLGDDKAVPVLEQWSAPGKPIESRTAAIRSLASLDKSNREITKQIAGYLSEPHFPVRMAAIYSLGGRGDATAVPALEALLKSGDLSIEMVPMIKEQIARLQKPAGKPASAGGDGGGNSSGSEKAGDSGVVLQRLERLERLVQEMNERLKSFETRLPPPKSGTAGTGNQRQGCHRSASKIRRSRKLFPVGPVKIASPSFEKKVNASLRSKKSRGLSPCCRARFSVSPSATAPAPGLFPSTPSVPALNTATLFPAILSAQHKTNAEFLPPRPSPFTGELTSPSAIRATRCPR